MNQGSHSALPALDADQLIEDYRRLIKLTNPEFVPYPDEDLVRSSRHLIRHAADVPAVLSAMASKPDWLLTHNTKVFTKTVAEKTALRVATPAEFFRALSISLNADQERQPRKPAACKCFEKMVDSTGPPRAPPFLQGDLIAGAEIYCPCENDFFQASSSLRFSA